ncbi:MAG: hypothetical protein PVS2B2_18640 [Candidatus Acidiferrum sp.]
MVMRLCLRFVLLLMMGEYATYCALAGGRPAQEETEYASHFNRGQELLKQFRFHDATAEFRESARLNPAYLPAQQALAIAYARTQNLALSWKQVRLLRQSAAELPAEFIQALSKRLSEAEAVKELEGIEQNLAAAQKSADEHPENPALLAALGMAFNKVGDYPRAHYEAERALQLDANQPEAHFLLGSMLAGEPSSSENAIPHFKLYLQKIPRSPETSKEIVSAYTMLASVYGRTGREAKSLATYEEGLKFAPDDEVLLNNAAWIYATAQDASLRDPQKALVYARKAATISKNEKDFILDTLAEALYANSQFDEAVTMEEKALSLNPHAELYEDQLKKFQAARQRSQQPRL